MIRIEVDKVGTLDLRGIVHIDECEYDNESIKKVIIGSSVETIGSFAFLGCSNLEEILFEEPCQITKLDEFCFCSCPKLRKIDLPSSIQELDHGALIDCSPEIVILRGECNIEKFFFRINNLTYLHIADSIQGLNENTFNRYGHIPLSESPCKIYIRPEFHDMIKRMFQGRAIEFIGNELEEGHVLK